MVRGHKTPLPTRLGDPPLGGGPHGRHGDRGVVVQAEGGGSLADSAGDRRRLGWGIYDRRQSGPEAAMVEADSGGVRHVGRTVGIRQGVGPVGRWS